MEINLSLEVLNNVSEIDIVYKKKVTCKVSERPLIGSSADAYKVCMHYWNPDKIELLEEFGIDHLVIIEFTSAFSEQSAEEYIRDFLIRQFQPHTIIIGYDHRFGKNRAGDYKLLEKMADVYHYQLKEISAHELNEIKISSTRIREALMQGNMDDANRLLGYTFFFSGEVIDGDKLGRLLGYPTANLKITDAEKIIPGDGIYAVYATYEQTKYKGMMSIGFRPTVNGKKRVV